MTDPDRRVRVMTVDDHPLLREGIAAVLEGSREARLVAEASNGREAVEQFRAHRPDVTLMDLKMPEVDGIDAIRQIRREFPGARVIVLTTYGGDTDALHALRAGAQGYLLKSALRKELVEAILGVHAGRRYIPADVARAIAEHVADSELSLRELEVLRHVAAGNSNKIVAGMLGVSEDTIKAHMKRIMEKLDARDRTHAVSLAFQRRLFDVR
ncbi:response regulator transcription factor [Dokdonella sp.]|uniref:response regulator n=1 Tax=Dokdonella sp. TaxID=2291710 RepID=UPI0026303934|nr:response regulator transcription factor [Dokdonella sp.]